MLWRAYGPSFSMCPICSRFVCRYFSFSGFAGTSVGTPSAAATPGPPHPPPFRPQVEDKALALPRDRLHRALELLSAVAALRPENVAREALRVDPQEHAGLPADVPFHDYHVVAAARELRLVAAEGHVLEVAVLGRKLRKGRAERELLAGPLGARAQDVGDHGPAHPKVSI